jgi:carbonic anhydrase
LIIGVTMKTLTQQELKDLSPKMALELLKEGNKRFINNLKLNRNLLQQANNTSDGQHPFAVILSCIDSRTSAELIFDQGLGDVFSIRIAGNIINEDILGSMEFGCKVAGSKLIVVMGHTKCGAIKGACDGVEMGNLTSLLSKISPSITQEESIKTNRTSSNDSFVEKVNILNINHAIARIKEESSILKDMIDDGSCAIIGAHHNIETGEVTFLND